MDFFQSVFVLISLYLRVVLLVNKVSAYPVLVCTAKLFSKIIVSNENSSCFTSLPMFGMVHLLNFSCSGGCVVLSHCDLLYFSDD